MWNRFPAVNLKDVAGTFRKQATDFASEVVKQAKTLAEEDEGSDTTEEDDPSPLQPDDNGQSSFKFRHQPSSQRTNLESTSARLRGTGFDKPATSSERQASESRNPNAGVSEQTRYRPGSQPVLISADDRKAESRALVGQNLPEKGRLHESSAVTSRIEALKAKLEADKAKRQQVSGSSGREQAQTSGNGPQRGAVVGEEAHKHEVTQPYQDTARPSKTIVEAQDLEDSPPQKSFLERGPVYSLSPFKDTDRESRKRHALLEDVIRSEDFEDIPLNSPHNSTQFLPTANGHAKMLPVPMKENSADEFEEASTGGTSELAKLQQLYQRLRAEMLENVAAHEDEVSMLQKDVQDREEELETLKTSERNLQVFHEDAVARLRAELEEMWQAKTAALEETVKSLEKDRLRLETELLQQQNSVKQELAETQTDSIAMKELETENQRLQAQVDQLPKLQAALDQERTSHGETIEHAEAAYQELERLKQEQNQSRSDDPQPNKDSELLRRCEEAEDHARELEAELEQHREDVRETIQDLAEENQEKDSRIASQEAEISGLRSEIAELRTTLEASTAEIDALRRQIGDITHEKDCALETCNNVRAELQEVMQHDSASAHTSPSELKARLREVEEAAEERIAAMDAKLAAAEEAAVKEMSAVRQEAERRLQAQQLESSEQLQAVQSKLSDTEDKLRVVEAERAAVQNEVEQRVKAVQHEAEDRLRVETEIRTRDQQAHDKAIESWRSELELLKWRLHDTTESAEELRSKMRKLAEENSEMHARLEQTSHSTLDQSEELKELRQERSDWRQRCEELEVRLANAADELRLLGDAQTSTLQQENELRLQLDTQKHEQASLMQRLAESQKLCEGLEQDIQNARNGSADSHRDHEIQLLEQALEEIRVELDRRDGPELAEVAELQSRCNDLESRLQDSEAKCSHLQDELSRLPKDQGSSSSHEAELRALRAALEDAETDRDKATRQLAKLKQQLVVEQDEEEEKIRWRVDAEVQSALRLATSEQEASESAISDLRNQLQDAHSQISGLQSDLAAWEKAVNERDVELNNLQGALGELMYESEAADRTKAELRAAKLKVQDLRSQVFAEKAAQDEVNREKAALEEQIQQLQEEMKAVQRREERLIQDMQPLHRTLQEYAQKIQALTTDSSAMIDRRIAVKLLTTYLSRGQSSEDLELMARMLGFTDEEKREVLASRKGVLRTVAAVPRSFVTSLSRPGTGQVPSDPNEKDTFTSSWVEFLQDPDTEDVKQNDGDSKSKLLEQ